MGKMIEKLKGKAMKAEGELTGDRVRKAQGSMKEAKGEALGIVERVKRGGRKVANKARSAADRVRGKIENKRTAARMKRGMR